MFCSNQDREATEKNGKYGNGSQMQSDQFFICVSCLFLERFVSLAFIHLLGAITMNPTNEQHIRVLSSPIGKNAGDPKWLLQTNAPRAPPS
jgi:hypothetical protein